MNDRSHDETGYVPKIRERVEEQSLVSAVAEFFGLPTAEVSRMWDAYRQFSESQGYAGKLGEWKTLSTEEAFLLGLSMSLTRPRTIVELGTQQGKSTRRIVDLVGFLGMDLRVITYDVADELQFVKRDEIDFRLEDLTGKFRSEVLDKHGSGLIFCDVPPYGLLSEVVRETIEHYGNWTLAIHDCGRGLCNPKMSIGRGDPNITSSTGLWERYVLAEAFGIDNPLSPALDAQNTAKCRMQIFETQHGVALLVPPRAAASLAGPQPIGPMPDSKQRIPIHNVTPEPRPVARTSDFSVRRVALIYDDTARRDTTGVYCRRALDRLADVEHFPPTELARLPREKFDLYLAIDDGLNYPIPPDLHPSAYWAIDTHLDFERELQRARQFDLVFAAQRDGTNRLREQGVPTTKWLPLACDPEIHGKQAAAKEYDVCFVGNMFAGPREDLVRLIQSQFPKSFVGRRFFAEMAQTYSASRVVFNRSLKNDVNMRVFEALASGSLLVTNDLRENGQDELFRDGIHMATYRDADELMDKVRFYLRNPELLERVAETGRQAVLAQHTYQHRMQVILETVESQLAKRTVQGRGVVEQTATPTDLQVIEGRAPGVRPCQPGLTSIILVTYGQLEYTRLCLDSLPSHTNDPYEVIVVDNGSTDGTIDDLRQRKDIKLIANSENRGFPAAANQGMLIAKGEFLLLLNNDTIVASDWLKRMLDAMRGDSRIGLVGPCSNNVSGEQRIPVAYDRPDGIDAFATEWGQAHDRQLIDTDRLVGFCLLIRRAVIDRVGLLDERFGIGNFEDDDFCRRALMAGYRAAIAVSAFVHHFGSRTFRASGVDFGKLLQENERKFREKWRISQSSGEPLRYGHIQNGDNSLDSTHSTSPAIDSTAPASTMPPAARPKHQPSSRFSIKRGPHRGLLLVPDCVRLSLCMIVRDNETTILAALESIRPWVDEIIVVDTGSRDKTPDICRQFGARVYEFPWCDDFSAARNESLKYARGEWIFWMDSDDTISAECGRQLRELANRPHADNVLGFLMQVHCPKPGEEGDVAVTIVDHVKLFRNRTDLRFEGRIHEQLLPAIRRAGGDVLWTDIHVVHSGSDHSPDGWQHKLERDFRILHRELEECPNHPFVLFNLGMTYADAKRFPEAVTYLEKSLAVSGPDETHVRKVFALLTSSLYQAQRYDDAWQACERGLARFSDDKELLFRSAMLHHHFGRLPAAEAAYLQVLNGHEERHLTSIDQDLAGYKARHNLAMVYDDWGKLDVAEMQWRRIVQEVPAYLDGWRGLADVLMRTGKLTDVDEICRQLASHDGRLGRESHLLRGKLAAARHDVSGAIHHYEVADRQNPQNLGALRELCQMLFEQGELELAVQRLRELTNRAPHDAAAFHNLGVVQFRRQAFIQSAEAFEKSVGLRPNAPETRLQWGWSLKSAGRIQEAIATWQETIRKFPGHSESLAALNSVGAAV